MKPLTPHRLRGSLRVVEAPQQRRAASPPPFRAPGQGHSLVPVYLRLQHAIENLLLAAVYLDFAWDHLQQGMLTHRWTTLAPIVVEETFLAAMFLARRPSTRTSAKVGDWVVAVVGTALPLAIRPGGVPWAFGAVVSPLGLLLSLAGLVSLGRSVGIVAANRGVRAEGAYGWVRHPMYAGHLLCLGGYLGSYPSLRNLVLVAGTAVALVARVHAEEALLALDPRYRAYRARVPWRLVPRVW